MKFTIRDLMFVMLLVGVSLGWLVDHQRAAKKQAEWEALFDDAMSELSVRSAGDYTFDPPIGRVTVDRKPSSPAASAQPGGTAE